MKRYTELIEKLKDNDMIHYNPNYQNNNLEIERKYILKDKQKVLDLDIKNEILISQNYIYFDKDVEQRIRFKEYRFFNDLEDYKEYLFTMKFGKGEVRTEITLKMKKPQYELLSNVYTTMPIVKYRKVIENNANYMIVWDRFINPECHDVIEVEFKDGISLCTFEKPDYLGERIEFSNLEVWKSLNNITE